MSRKHRNRQNERAAAPREERGAEPDSPADGPPPDQVSEAVNPGTGSHKTQKHKVKRFGHN
ncbi:hypothetical protein [Streptomyces sp. MAR4 CNX-425]|uniref:hypothetical protein n=1 Tax=Streptomyces sp. MAR4 CNX-425 TaxID=3406343 RepID=UPI003B5136C0